MDNNTDTPAGAAKRSPDRTGAGTGARTLVKGTKGDQAKEARIKAALKANIARRKEQAKGRDTGEQDDG